MEVGAGLPHDDWIGGRWLEGWGIGIKLPCGRKKINQETHNCQTEKKDLVMGSRQEPDTKIHWPTDRRSQTN
jgi:hypothetical protein